MSGMEIVLWDTIDKHVKRIAYQINSRVNRNKIPEPIGILGVSRGGLIPAVLLSHQLGISNLHTIVAKTYGDDKSKKKSGFIGSAPTQCQDGTGWIVIDDIADTGETFEYIRSMLPNALYVALVAKGKGTGQCNIYGQELVTDAWVQFPWEL